MSSLFKKLIHGVVIMAHARRRPNRTTASSRWQSDARWSCHTCAHAHANRANRRSLTIKFIDDIENRTLKILLSRCKFYVQPSQSAEIGRFLSNLVNKSGHSKIDILVLDLHLCVIPKTTPSPDSKKGEQNVKHTLFMRQSQFLTEPNTRIIKIPPKKNVCKATDEKWAGWIKNKLFCGVRSWLRMIDGQWAVFENSPHSWLTQAWLGPWQNK